MRSDLIVAFSCHTSGGGVCAWQAPPECGRAVSCGVSNSPRSLRSLATSLRNDTTLTSSLGPVARQTCFRRHTTSACREGTSLTKRRSSFVSSNRRLQLGPALAKMGLERIGPGAGIHLRPAQLFAARFGRVRPIALAFRKGVCLLVEQLPVARLLLRSDRGGRPYLPDGLDRTQVCGKISVKNRHALDDSASRFVLPAPHCVRRISAGDRSNPACRTAWRNAYRGSDSSHSRISFCSQPIG